MAEKKYAIVRVDNSCPAMSADFGCIIARNILHCKCGEDAKNYGDTKEQLIKKVAQAILRSEVKSYKKYYGITPMRIITRDVEAQCLKVAKEIVEFLGVEE